MSEQTRRDAEEFLRVRGHKSGVAHAEVRAYTYSEVLACMSLFADEIREENARLKALHDERTVGHQQTTQEFEAAEAEAADLRSQLATLEQEAQPYQSRVRAWVLGCFGPDIADDVIERSFRFLEEALELVQAAGCTKEQAAALVEYVYSRDVGSKAQEVGGVMVTLAALTGAAGLDLEAEAERELERVSTPEVTAKILRKQAAKRRVVSHAGEAALPGE